MELFLGRKKWDFPGTGKTSSHLIYLVQFVRHLSLTLVGDCLVLLAPTTASHTKRLWFLGNFGNAFAGTFPQQSKGQRFAGLFHLEPACVWLSARVWGQPDTTFLSLAFCLCFPEFFMLIYMSVNTVTCQAKALLLFAL